MQKRVYNQPHIPTCIHIFLTYTQNPTGHHIWRIQHSNSTLQQAGKSSNSSSNFEINWIQNLTHIQTTFKFEINSAQSISISNSFPNQNPNPNPNPNQIQIQFKSKSKLSDAQTISFPSFKLSDSQIVKFTESQITNFTETCLNYKLVSEWQKCRDVV